MVAEAKLDKRARMTQSLLVYFICYQQTKLAIVSQKKTLLYLIEHLNMYLHNCPYAPPRLTIHNYSASIKESC